MATVGISSSDGSTGRDGEDSSDGGRSSSPSLVSSSYLERPEQEEGPGPRSPVRGGERVINGISLFLLQGRIDIDVEWAEPAGGWTTIGGYDWASHEMGSYEFEFSTREELHLWAEQSFIARDGEDAHLISLGVSHPNERVFHGKGSDRIVEGAGRLKLETKRLTASEKDLQEQVDCLAGELVKANEAIGDPLAVGFDIGQDVYDGKMMLVDASPAEEDGAAEEEGHLDEDDDA
ncbi:hypothetical protein LR48_Vigan03g139300 [Vigna angularis]|uniref:Uncharacterized protein n=1 Tax=Phaseolus angularis TaxID=3914 RepID=A0A0L9U5H6_PHAAN|nr:hypothetical protein LR48_Vigan03g139300 [Vigna angularis]